MSRAQKRRKPQRRTGAFENKQPGTRPVVDSTLRTLLVNYLALPDGNTVFTPDGRVYMSAEALMYSRAITEREAQLPPAP